MLISAAVCNGAWVVYPIELILGIVIAWYLGEGRLEKQRKEHYFLGSRNFVNEIFAYNGNLIWTVLFLCLAYVQIEVRCRNYALLPQDPRNMPSNPLRGLLKQYASKIVLKNVLLMVIFWIIDGIFILTGGSCLMGPETRSAEKCRTSGGKWTGGFDISGHFCFLVNISMILWFELSQYRRYVEREVVESLGGMLTKAILAVTVAVLTIWILMLMVTSIYYHTVLEKILGCLMGYICVAVMYWLIPRSPVCNRLLYC